MSEWDANGDQALDETELTKAPGLAAGAVLIDQNRDGKLSVDELTSRFELYRQNKLGLSTRQLRVTYRGRPVGGAEIQLVPETFLDGVIEPAKGTSNEMGLVEPNAGVEGLPGLRSGYYRVQVTSANGAIPAKFGVDAPLGVEVSNLRDDSASYGPIDVRLTD